MDRAYGTLECESGGPMIAPPRVTFLPPTFDAVYEESFDFVWRSVQRLGVKDANVDDVVQEVFVVVHQKLAEFAGRSSIKTWLTSIVLFAVRHHRRTWRRKDSHHAPGMERQLEDLPDPARRGPLEAAETSDNVRLLVRLLGELDDEKREVFVLSHLEEMSAVEIAEVLGANLNTVYSRLRVAKEQFERAVERQRARDARRQG
jgi:RNA polymerase sigma-70 factor (ECF subfamily)